MNTRARWIRGNRRWAILSLYLIVANISLQNGGFETPAESGALTNFVEIGQARDKILSLKLDQVRSSTFHLNET
jgi:hypothetical protein